MATHELKTWPVYYQAIVDGRKTADIRYNDRTFCEGDLLWLREWKRRGGYTGRFTVRQVTHVMIAMGLQSGHVMLSLAPICHGQECPESRKSPACDLADMRVMSSA